MYAQYWKASKKVEEQIMAVQDTENDIAVGGSALIQFIQIVNQHPAPLQLGMSFLSLLLSALTALQPQQPPATK